MSTVAVFCGKDHDPVEVECEFIGRYIAIHKPHGLSVEPPRGWNVTHRPTGFAIFSHVKSKRDARRAAERMRKQAKASGLDLRIASADALMKAEGWKEFADLGRELRKQLARF